MLNRLCKCAACLVIALITMCLSEASAQVGPTMEVIQAVVPDLRSPRQGLEVDEALRLLPGVMMSRTDHNTRNLLLHVTGSSVVDAAAIMQVLAHFDLALRCYQRGPLGTAPLITLDPRACRQPTELR